MQVQELVGIVPWTFIAQICNLFLQMYLIKRFLFKPVKNLNAIMLLKGSDMHGIFKMGNS